MMYYLKHCGYLKLIIIKTVKIHKDHINFICSHPQVSESILCLMENGKWNIFLLDVV